jgi:hypothetical protein
VLLVAATVPPVYFAAVAFGRATMLGEGATIDAIMTFGGARFHFWWGAALIPMIWLAWNCATQRMPRGFERTGVAILAIVTVLIAVPKSVGGWRYPEAFAARVLAFDRNDSCIASNVVADRPDFTCPQSSSGNIGPLIQLAYQHDLAFIEDAGLPPGPSH